MKAESSQFFTLNAWKLSFTHSKIDIQFQELFANKFSMFGTSTENIYVFPNDDNN